MTSLEKLNEHSIEVCKAKILVCKELEVKVKEIEKDFKKYNDSDVVNLSFILEELNNFQKSLSNQIQNNTDQITRRKKNA